MMRGKFFNHLALVWQTEQQRFFRSAGSVLLLGFQLLLCGLLFSYLLLRYEQAQANGLLNLSFSNDVLTPFYGAIAAILLCTSPLYSSVLWSRLQQQQQLHFYTQLPNRVQWLAWRMVATCVLQWLWLVPLFLLVAVCSVVTPLDWGQWLSTLLGCLLLLPACVSVQLLISMHFSRGVLTLMAGFSAVAIWLLLDAFSHGWGALRQWQTFRDGWLSLSAISYFLLCITGTLAWVFFRLHRQHVIWKKMLALAALFLIASAMVDTRWLIASDPNVRLAPELQHWLQTRAPPATLTVIGQNQDTADRYFRQLQSLQQWQSAWHIDRRLHSELSAEQRERLPQQDGVIIRVGEREEWVMLPQQPLLPLMVLRAQHLSTLADAWIAFSDGHGERRLFSDQTRDLGQWSQLLKQTGFYLAPLNWSLEKWPDNIRVLVIAGYTTAFISGEWEQLKQFLDRGGHLLWLRDPESPAFPELERYLGVHMPRGVVLDPAAVRRGTPHPAIAVIDRFPIHAAFGPKQALVALPWAGVLQHQNGAFEAQPLLVTHEQSVLADSADRDPNSLREQAQSFVVAYALQRSVAVHDAASAVVQKQQRIIVVGDSHFVADTAIHNYGNANMATGFLNWLMFGDQTAVLPQWQAPDAVFLPSVHWRWILYFVLPLFLPFSVLALLWYRLWVFRRHA